MVELIDLGIMYWWDAVAAVSLVHDDGTIATFQGVRVDVIQDGEQSGRTVIVPAGRPIQAAYAADTVAFEQRFLDSLNGRP